MQELPKYIKMIVYPYTSDAFHYKVFKLFDNDEESEIYGYVVNYANDYKEKYRTSSKNSINEAISKMKSLLIEEQDYWVESSELEWLDQFQLQKDHANS